MTTTSQHKNSICAHDLTPRPRWPMNLHTSYALDEGGTRDFAISTPHFSRGRRVQEIHKMQNSGAPPFEPVPGAEQSHSAELVLLAMGSLGPSNTRTSSSVSNTTHASNAAIPAYTSSAEGIFAAGDRR